jgi:hypothetical protein
LSERVLTPFWIVPPSKYGPLGFGVTAFDLADALDIIKSIGYILPEDTSSLEIIENIMPETLHPHVAAHMGPMIVRGLWYPFFWVGV